MDRLIGPVQFHLKNYRSYALGWTEDRTGPRLSIPDEFGPWRLCLPDIPYRKTVIHNNDDLVIAGHPGYMKTYAKIARAYY